MSEQDKKLLDILDEHIASDEFNEDALRVVIRDSMIEHNKSLQTAAYNAGVQKGAEFGTFQNKGYMGLYDGLTAQEIHEKKKLKKSQKILDYMGSEELAANLFRATQADGRLRREGVSKKEDAYKVHFEVGQEVRGAIKKIGGTMPEDLPVPEKSIKQIRRELAKKNM